MQASWRNLVEADVSGDHLVIAARTKNRCETINQYSLRFRLLLSTPFGCRRALPNWTAHCAYRADPSADRSPRQSEAGETSLHMILLQGGTDVSPHITVSVYH